MVLAGFSLAAEGGIIIPFENRGDPADGIDDVRLTDRFMLGEPQMRGFDIRGIGPRVVRQAYEGVLNDDGSVTNQLVDLDLSTGSSNGRLRDTALGGRKYYHGRAELEIPLGSGAREMGLRPSIFVDIGAVWDVVQPILQADVQAVGNAIVRNQDNTPVQAVDANGNPSFTAAGDPIYETGTGPLYYTVIDDSLESTLNAIGPDGSANTMRLTGTERFLGNSAKPRISLGVGTNWNSPFGPFRIDLAYAITQVEGDDTKTFSFNVGTGF